MASLIIGSIIAGLASGIATKTLFQAAKKKKINIGKNILDAVTNPFNFIPVGGIAAGITGGIVGESIGQGLDAITANIKGPGNSKSIKS